MEEKPSTAGEILRKESVGYLKSKINLQQGTLVMTSRRISLDAHKTAVGGLGLIGALLKSHVEKEITVFNLEYSDIQSVTQGKHGIQKNVLEITNKQGVTYRIIVKNYQEWEDAIRQKM